MNSTVVRCSTTASDKLWDSVLKACW